MRNKKLLKQACKVLIARSANGHDTANDASLLIDAWQSRKILGKGSFKSVGYGIVDLGPQGDGWKIPARMGYLHLVD